MLDGHLKWLGRNISGDFECRFGRCSDFVYCFADERPLQYSRPRSTPGAVLPIYRWPRDIRRYLVGEIRMGKPGGPFELLWWCSIPNRSTSDDCRQQAGEALQAYGSASVVAELSLVERVLRGSAEPAEHGMHTRDGWIGDGVDSSEVGDIPVGFQSTFDDAAVVRN